MKLYLIGLPGSGKSSFGKQLADEAKVPFIDLDQIIEQESGMAVSQLFSEKGEDYFRNIEAVALRQQSKKSEFIMACGGGTPCFHNNMKFINESGTSIFLNVPLTEIITRLNTAEQQNRPLLADTTQESLEQKLKALLEKRINFYRQANLILNNPGSPAEVLRQLAKS
jgi:shikimate kinase